MFRHEHFTFKVLGGPKCGEQRSSHSVIVTTCVSGPDYHLREGADDELQSMHLCGCLLCRGGLVHLKGMRRKKRRRRERRRKRSHIVSFNFYPRN